MHTHTYCIFSAYAYIHTYVYVGDKRRRRIKKKNCKMTVIRLNTRGPSHMRVCIVSIISLALAHSGPSYSLFSSSCCYCYDRQQQLLLLLPLHVPLLRHFALCTHTAKETKRPNKQTVDN